MFTAPVDPAVASCKLNPKAPPVNAPSKLITPVPLFSVVAAPNVTPVPASPNVMVVFPVATVPSSVTPLGAVAVNPPVNVLVPKVRPIVNAPRLLNVVAPAIVFAAPVIDTL